MIRDKDLQKRMLNCINNRILMLGLEPTINWIKDNAHTWGIATQGYLYGVRMYFDTDLHMRAMDSDALRGQIGGIMVGHYNY